MKAMPRRIPQQLHLAFATTLVLVFVAACADSSNPTGIDNVSSQASVEAAEPVPLRPRSPWDPSSLWSARPA